MCRAGDTAPAWAMRCCPDQLFRHSWLARTLGVSKSKKRSRAEPGPHAIAASGGGFGPSAPALVGEIRPVSKHESALAWKM